MATFPRGYSSRQVWAKHRRELARLDGQSVQTAAGKVTWVQDPQDLRGLPMIGRGVQGAIRYTRPGDSLHERR